MILVGNALGLQFFLTMHANMVQETCTENVPMEDTGSNYCCKMVLSD